MLRFSDIPIMCLKVFDDIDAMMEAKLFLRTVIVSGAGVLRFSDIPIMCLKVFDDIDAMICVKNA